MPSGFGAKNPQPCEDAAEVVADCREDSVGGVAGAAFEIAPAEVTFGFEVADHGLDRGSSSQLAFDDAEHAALLSRDEDSACILRIVSAVHLVDIGRARSRRPVSFWVWSMTSRRVCPSYAGCRAAPWHAARTDRPGRWALVVTMETLTPELVGRAGLSLADALGLGGMEGE